MLFGVNTMVVSAMKVRNAGKCVLCVWSRKNLTIAVLGFLACGRCVSAGRIMSAFQDYLPATKMARWGTNLLVAHFTPSAGDCIPSPSRQSHHHPSLQDERLLL